MNLSIRMRVLIMVALSVVATGILIIGIFFYFLSQGSEQLLQRYENTLVETRKSSLADNAEIAMHAVGHYYDLSQPTALTKSLQERSQAFAQNLGSRYKILLKQMPPERAKKQLLGFIEQYRYDQGNGYYWVQDQQANIIMHPQSPNLIGSNQMDLSDPNGVLVFKEFAQVSQSNRGRSLNYSWVNPTSNQLEKKIGYGIYLPETGWIIGTGLYIPRMKSQLQAQAAKVINQLRFGDKGYFWINDFKANMIMHPIKPALNGKDLSQMEDPNGLKIFSEFASLGKEQGQGFVKYYWPKPGYKNPQPKISFIKAFPDWQWVLGTGVYVEDLDLLVASEAKAINSLFYNIVIMVSVGSLVGLVVLMVIFAWSINRSVNAPLLRLAKNIREASVEVALAAGSIADSSNLLSSSVTQQAASIQESSSSIQQISSQAKSNADKAGQAAHIMEHVQEISVSAAQEADESMTQSITMSEVSENGVKAMGNIGRAMTDIQENSDQVYAIIDILNEITQHTKMLATNAAIEGARAGQQGLGFNVVANEISKLAAGSKKNAKEIRAIIQHSHGATESGSQMASQGKEVLREIRNEADGLHHHMEAIQLTGQEQKQKVLILKQEMLLVENASREQAEGVRQISLALNELSEGLQTNSAISQESAAAASQLSAQSEELSGMLDTFGSLLGVKIKTSKELAMSSHKDEPFHAVKLIA
ncbi:MAG: cache domain-containing protein [SAR324 cluster bacterium]|nr:cache domain-containing protein [SAR324 cluster bacterium]